MAKRTRCYCFLSWSHSCSLQRREGIKAKEAPSEASQRDAVGAEKKTIRLEITRNNRDSESCADFRCQTNRNGDISPRWSGRTLTNCNAEIWESEAGAGEGTWVRTARILRALKDEKKKGTICLDLDLAKTDEFIKLIFGSQRSSAHLSLLPISMDK